MRSWLTGLSFSLDFHFQTFLGESCVIIVWKFPYHRIHALSWIYFLVTAELHHGQCWAIVSNLIVITVLVDFQPRLPQPTWFLSLSTRPGPHNPAEHPVRFAVATFRFWYDFLNKVGGFAKYIAWSLFSVIVNWFPSSGKLRPLITNHSSIIFRPHRDFLVNNTAFRLIIYHHW